MGKKCAIVSFRLGGNDGVAVVARTWEAILQRLGWQTSTIAGSAPAGYVLDAQIDGLAIGSQTPVDTSHLRRALADADLVLCENILSLPLNLGASVVLAKALADRPAILHHHDLAWQQQRHSNISALPMVDAAWRHVAISRLSVEQLRSRGIPATLIYNGFDVNIPEPDRHESRSRYGFAADELVVVHPVRAIERKGIARAVDLTSQLGGTYWLTGPTEENYEKSLQHILQNADCRVLRQPATSRAELYEACDLVAFPSLWEGFGNPPIEAAIHRRPAAVGSYPVGQELRKLGFSWLDPDDSASVRRLLASDHSELLDENRRLAVKHFSLDRLADDIKNLLATFP